MGKIVGVSVEPGGRTYHYDAGLFVLSCGSRVIVETENGLEFGTVITPPRPTSEEESDIRLKKVYRLANDADIAKHRKNVELEKESHAYCLKCIDELGLEMNLVSVRSQFDGTKLTFYFTADGRVDFRGPTACVLNCAKSECAIEPRFAAVWEDVEICFAVLPL